MRRECLFELGELAACVVRARAYLHSHHRRAPSARVGGVDRSETRRAMVGPKDQRGWPN